MTKQEKYEIISANVAQKFGAVIESLEYLSETKENNFLIATDRYTYVGVSDDEDSLKERIDVVANIIRQMGETVKSGTEVDATILPPYIAAVYNNIKLFFNKNGRLPDFDIIWSGEVDGVFIKVWVDESMFELRKDKE